MSREVVLRVRCDKCGIEQAPDVSVTLYEWAWDNRQLELDLCALCKNNFDTHLSDVLVVSRKAETKTPKKKKHTIASSSPSAAVDLKPGRTASGKKSKSVWGKYVDEKTGQFNCPVCTETFQHSQGLGRHAAAKHTDYTP